MPLYAYCPHTACAARIPYEAIKPTRCPQCGKLFADAFKVKVQATVVEPEAIEPEPIDEPVRLTRSAIEARRHQSRTKLKPRPAHGHVSPTPEPEEAGIDPIEDVDPGEGDGYIDEGVVHRRARELAASIDPSTISVSMDDDPDERISFGTLWEQGKASREAAAKRKATPTKAAIRKRSSR